MIRIDTLENIENLIKESQMLLVYFEGNNCGVCSAMKPKVEDMLKLYPKIKSAEVNIEKKLEIAAAFNIFTIPAILVFIEGKQILREARHISIEEVNNKIKRYYSLLYE